jgi:formate/nitrite transporter FocA (FNT family)
MENLIEIISSNGIGVVCVAYLIYFQSTTMKEMIKTLNTINERLTIIEEKIERRNKKKSGDKDDI